MPKEIWDILATLLLGNTSKNFPQAWKRDSYDSLAELFFKSINDLNLRPRLEIVNGKRQGFSKKPKAKPTGNHRGRGRGRGGRGGPQGVGASEEIQGWALDRIVTRFGAIYLADLRYL